MDSVHLSAFIVLCLLIVLLSAEEEIRHHPDCPPFPCGKLGMIKFPFTITTRPAHCGLITVDGCDNKSDVQKIRMEKHGTWYKFENISQGDAIFIQDEMLLKHLRSRDCITFNNLTFPTLPYISFEIVPKLDLLKCNRSPCNASGLKHGYSSCCNFSICRSRESENYSYPPPHCSYIQLPLNQSQNQNHSDIFQQITAQFSLLLNVSSSCRRCYYRGGECLIDSKKNFYCSKSNEGNKNVGLKIGLAASFAGIVLISVYFGRKFFLNNSIFCRNKKGSDHEMIEAALRNQGSLAPRRYRYSEVKRITKSFREKLGNGGYGSVFKGKLPDGRLVAVKVLKDSKSNGEDFGNEVASISRTSHVNIVILLGFCFEGSKRALIYEFMPNGSLEKYIYEESTQQGDRKLGWQTLYQIAVGIGQGLEYLHRGCNTRILHFDIKPHNILLDKNFCPKISDFGLSKICTNTDSVVSMLGARGTLGYIAPEVFSRNIGGVSHKSDVYSYGMMVLEMVGGRKNVCVEVDHSSEIYFPHWIHNRIELGKELGLLGITSDEENQIARKMILVSLWCIQIDPSNRPPMCRVVEMLQGSPESLPAPPKPYSSSPSSLPTAFADSSSSALIAFSG